MANDQNVTKNCGLMSSHTLFGWIKRTDSTIGAMTADVASKYFSCFWAVDNFFTLESDFRNWSYFCCWRENWVGKISLNYWLNTEVRPMSENIPKFDGQKLDAPKRKRPPYECGIPVACCVSTVNVPCIHRRNMTSPKMCQIAPTYLGIDRTICPPILSDYRPFHDKQHSAFVVPLASTMSRLSRCLPAHLSIVVMIFSYFAPDQSIQPEWNGNSKWRDFMIIY